MIGDAIILLGNVSFAAMEVTRRAVGRRSVPTISTEQLCDDQQQPRSCFQLVDVRSHAEQAVSMIPGAITAEQYESAPQRHQAQTIVPYCTIGGRSYLYARRLVASGIDAKNYRDSVIGWCRHELPLVTPEGVPTRAVHPYWRVFTVPSSYTIKM
ncbi:rhodanese-like domain-containing protein [Stieleria sp. TO1_6]|uniref:rhodanese-like domain-containing protein n=1 Tax=Stieleria tagensis TaxID=2956795 RepID=UPI00209BA7C4|nr:rhodanese-like domain-containing protein [Stieleria tagensis]MCO8125342.1 rhodanese-like domain-containing protein [Stieleria tagensis]